MLAPFPLKRQRREIERCADVLDSHHGENANRFWRAEMEAKAKFLRDQGVDEKQVSEQIAAFNEAVQLELTRRWLSGLQSAP